MLEAQNETMYPWMKCFTSLVVDSRLRTLGLTDIDLGFMVSRLAKGIWILQSNECNNGGISYAGRYETSFGWRYGRTLLCYFF